MVAMSGGKDSYAHAACCCAPCRRGRRSASIWSRSTSTRGSRATTARRSNAGSQAEGIPLQDPTREHLRDRHRQDPRGEDLLLALLPAAARHPLPRGRRARLQQDRARPSPRRRARDAAPEPVLRRQAGVDAAASDHRRRPLRRHPPARLRRGEPIWPRFAAERGFPILPCLLCGSQDEAQRKQMKALLDELETQAPAPCARRCSPRSAT